MKLETESREILPCRRRKTLINNSGENPTVGLVMILIVGGKLWVERERARESELLFFTAD